MGLTVRHLASREEGLGWHDLKNKRVTASIHLPCIVSLGQLFGIQPRAREVSLLPDIYVVNTQGV